MATIEKKLGSVVYPGFDGFKSYFKGIADNFWDYKSNADVTNNGTAIVFGDSNNPGDDMLWIMNRTEFRAVHNLLPAGTDAVTAFCQIYLLKYQDKLKLGSESGTYVIKCYLWPDLKIYQNNPQLSQEYSFTYGLGDEKKQDFLATVCL